MVLRNFDDPPIEFPDQEEEGASFIEQLVAACAPCDGDEDWPEAATQDLPETSQAERLVLQARIAALGPAEDEAILELSCDEAAQAA